MMETRKEEYVTNLMSIYEPVVRACCRFYQLPDDRIEDITHDTFIAAYKNLARYRGQTKLSTWLWRIARHQIIDQMRRESIRHRIEQTLGHSEPIMDAGEPVGLTQRKELCHVLRKATEALRYE